MINYFFPSVMSFKYRLLGSFVVSIILSLYFCFMIISFCKKRKIQDEVRDLGLEHQEKKNVPSMGGVAIILSTLISTLLFADLKNIYIQLLILSMVIIGGIGFYDDYKKDFQKSKKGVEPLTKLVIQGILGLIISFSMVKNNNISVSIPMNYKTIELKAKDAINDKKIVTKIPFSQKTVVNYDTSKMLNWGSFIIYALILTFIISGTSNAVNLADGIDGLALKNSIIALSTLLLFTFLCGDKNLSNYFNTLYISNITETTILCLSLIMSCLMCLWMNAFPAKIFIGDTGSLMLGGVIAVLAAFLRIEWFLPILCGVFMFETISVILQVFYFKYTKKKYGIGKKLFLLSPLHYHMIKKGLEEVNVTSKLTIISFILSFFTIFLFL